MKIVTSIALATLVAQSAACAFYVRSPDDYRRAVRNLLDDKRGDVDACFKRAYDADAQVKGQVTVAFTVEPKTGKIVKPEVVNAKTTAPEALSKCVLASLDGLVLTPADQKAGAATFTWDFGG
jgi:hypothetical protein